MADVIQNVLVQRTTSTGGQFTDFVPVAEVSGQISTVAVTAGSPAAATANTAAINAALAAGGIVRLPAGVIYINGTLQATTQGKLVGYGSSAYSDVSSAANQTASINVASTSIRWDTPTGVGLLISGSGFAVEDVHFANVYTAGALTAGAAIQLNKGNGSNLTRVTTGGWYIGFDVVQAALLNMTNCKAISYWYCGVRLNDTDSPNGGDWTLTACLTTADILYASNPGYVKPLAGVKLVGGGGLKLLGHKFNSASTSGFFNTYGFWAQPTQTGQDWTVVATGISIENCFTAGVFYDGSFGISSVQFGQWIGVEYFANAGSAPAFIIQGSSTCTFANGSIDDLTLIGLGNMSTNGAISIVQYAQAITIGTITYNNGTAQASAGPFLSLNPSNANNSNISLISYDITKMACYGLGSSNTIFVSDNCSNHLNGQGAGPCVKTLNRELNNAFGNISAGTPFSFAFCTISNSFQAYVKVRLAGIINSGTNGSLILVAERCVTVNGSGAATITTIGTDFVSAANLFTVTMTFASNILTIQVTNGSGLTGSINFAGEAQVEFIGATGQIGRIQ